MLWNKGKEIELLNAKLELVQKQEKIASRDKFIENQCKIIESLKEDSTAIREESYNAEMRATEYARKIKAIEEVMNSKDTLKNKNIKINEILFN